jgi:peptidoglycan/xylan/chitin deacetylase (PgdA/CDA1 family)
MTSRAKFYRSVRAGFAPTAKSLLFNSGALGALRAVRPSDRLAILRYHAICGAEGHAYASPSICISPEAFAQHARYLAANYSVVSLPDAVKCIRTNRTLPPNAVAITFDDGYADNLAAARTLAAHGLTATFYITAGCVGGGQPFWPAELRYLIAAITDERVSLSAVGTRLVLDLRTSDSRLAAIGTLTKTFKSHPISVREALRDQLRARASRVTMPRVMLTWDELREMNALGMTIGSHTMTHPNLPNAGLTAARDELIASRMRLEEEMGSPVTMFSYPNGGAERYLTPLIQQIVRDVGYEAATTSHNAFAGRNSDLYALERVEVEEALRELVFALEMERFAFKPEERSRGHV